jgi:hypothetical protein
MSVPFGHVKRKVSERITRPFISWSIPAPMLNFLRYSKVIGDLAIISCLSLEFIAIPPSHFSS